MLTDSDKIYKNIGIAVCITFLIYILISVVQIQIDIGSSIAKCGSRILKEGFVSKDGNDSVKDIDKLIKKLIKDNVETTIVNYKAAGMTKNEGNINIIDKDTVKLVIEYLKSKSDMFMSEIVANLLDKESKESDAFDYSKMAEHNNVFTLITTMISALEKTI